MRKAVIDIILVAGALLLIFLVVMLVIFGRQAGIFQQSLSSDKIIKANEQCKAFTATALRKNDQLVDTDFDDMDDVCDVCPNNYLSSKGDEVDTDRDRDGLSEEGLDNLHSPYNRGEYVINLCDKENLAGKTPQCANDWDEVRGKCRCGILENGQRTGAGFYMDRCARQDEWDTLKNQAYEPAIRATLQQIHELFKQLRFARAKDLWNSKVEEWRSQKVTADVPFMTTANALGIFYAASTLGPNEITVLDQIKDQSPDTSRMDTDFDNFLRGMSYLILAKHEPQPDRKRNLMMSADAELFTAQDKYRISRQTLADLARSFYRGKTISGVDSGPNHFEVNFQDGTQVFVADALVPLGFDIDPSRVISLSVPVHYWMAQGLADLLQDYCRGKSCVERSYSAFDNNMLAVSLPLSMREIVGSIETALKSSSFAQVHSLWSEHGLGLTQKYPDDAVILLQVDILVTYFPQQPLGENQRAIFIELASKQFDLSETQVVSSDIVRVIHALSRLRLAMEEQGSTKRARLAGAEYELKEARNQQSLEPLYQEIESQARAALGPNEIIDVSSVSSGWRVQFRGGDTLNLQGPSTLAISWGTSNLVPSYRTDQVIVAELKSRLARYCQNRSCTQRVTWGDQQMALPVLITPMPTVRPLPD